MPRVEKSINVNVPVKVAYNQWTQFETFPQFMEGVKAVRQLDDKRLRWEAEIGGKDLSWTAEILEQIPDQRIAWRSTSGDKNDGMVTFQYEDPNTTRITLGLDYDPEGLVENAGDKLGVVGHRVEGDLKRFKEFIEARQQPTGAWRGEIKPEVKTPAQAGASASSGGGAKPSRKKTK